MRLIAVILALFTLAACATTVSEPPLGSDGKPLPRLYKIRSSDTSKIQFRMLDSVNALRTAAGRQAVEMDAKLLAAAATHARDMSIQNRPWHFGSDGSSPIDRVARVGYPGFLVGEAISETYETELDTLAAWMEEPGSRAVILDPVATDMGFAWHQESNGKIWWTLVMGAPSLVPNDRLAELSDSPLGLQ
nr:CAP domain-containing protein [Cognatishimia maritima]